MASAQNPLLVISGASRLEKPETTSPEQGLRRILYISKSHRNFRNLMQDVEFGGVIILIHLICWLVMHKLS